MSIKGQIKIRKGNENHAPVIVLVSHKNSWDAWVCEILNTTETVFTIDENDLIDFNYKLFQQMYWDWKIENQDKIKKRAIEMRKEWD